MGLIKIKNTSLESRRVEVGDILVDSSGSHYIVSQVEFGECKLISLNSGNAGNRYCDKTFRVGETIAQIKKINEIDLKKHISNNEYSLYIKY